MIDPDWPDTLAKLDSDMKRFQLILAVAAATVLAGVVLYKLVDYCFGGWA